MLAAPNRRYFLANRGMTFTPMIAATTNRPMKPRIQYRGNPGADAGADTGAGDTGGGETRDDETRTGNVNVIPLVLPVRSSSCEPASVPGGMVTFTLTSPEESAVTVPSTAGVECKTIVMVSSGA